MPSTVRAAVCRVFGAPLSIEALTLADPGPGEVQVRLGAVAICHSDVFYADGAWGGLLPAVWGHEAAGTVEAVGEGVHLAVGHRVVVTLIRSCGQCHHCRRREFVACTATFPLDETSPLTDMVGRSVTHGLRTAAFAERVVVHESQVVPISEDVPMAAAALLACGVITGVGAVRNTAHVEPGSSVVIIGCGGVGLNVVQGAALAEASMVIAVDLQQSKLDVAERFGATHSVNPTTEDAARRVYEITGGTMADFVFVAAGSKGALDSGFGLVGPMGALVIVGMPPGGVTTEIDPGTIAGSNQRILGSKMGTADIAVDIPELIVLYHAHKLELDALISGTFALDDINDAIDEVRRGTALRNVVVFGDQASP